MAHDDTTTPPQGSPQEPSTDTPRPARCRSRAESPAWQKIERIGQRYLHVSKRVAQFISAIKEG